MTLDHVTDTSPTMHEHYLDLLTLQFCREAYDLYYNHAHHTLISIASLLNYSVEDVNHGINAFTNFLGAT